MMNMQKVGIFEQFKPRGKNGSHTGSNPMKTGIRAIHYAYFRDGQGGTVRGMVSRFTYLGLSVSPPEVFPVHLANPVRRSQVAVLVPLQLRPHLMTFRRALRPLLAIRSHRLGGWANSN